MATATDQRLRSLDILRGFDMFWIIGGDWLVNTLTRDTKNPLVGAVAAQFIEHVEWEGFRFYDMIFPLFLFLIGAVLPFSLGRYVEKGADRRELLRKIASRTALLFGLGLIYNGALRLEGFDHLRLCGVLPRLAFGYGFAAVCFLYTRPKTQALMTGAILLGYWGLMALAPFPGPRDGLYTEWGNWANYIDRQILLPGQLYDKFGDPEGIVSTLPAFATALLGLLSGHWLKAQADPKRRIGGLLLAGVGCVALGLLWGPTFPIIKKIWTSSYVLVAGGASMMLVAVFHYLFDIRGWHRWATPFTVIGMNSILIYMLSSIVDFEKISRYFLGGVAHHLDHFADPIVAAGTLAVKIGLLYFLYRNKLFFRV